MADNETLLQSPIDTSIYDRFVAQREKFGMTNREFLSRVLLEALPRWEAAPEPAPVAAKR